MRVQWMDGGHHGNPVLISIFVLCLFSFLFLALPFLFVAFGLLFSHSFEVTPMLAK